MKGKIQEIRHKRRQYLFHLYETAEDQRHKNVNMWDLGKELGFSQDETRRIVEYLRGENLLKYLDHDGNISITHSGVVRVEESVQAVDTDSEERVLQQDSLTKLRKTLVRRFSEGELRTLCFDLSEDYDDLSGEGKADKVRELVSYMVRRDRIPELVETGKQLRSDISWSDLQIRVEEVRLKRTRGINLGNDGEISTPDNGNSGDLLLLQGLLDELPVIKDLDFYHPDFQRWHNTVQQCLLQIFSQDSRQVEKYNKIAWHTSDKPEDAVKQQELYLRSCVSADGQLGAAIYALKNLCPAMMEKTQEERVSEAELLLAFYKWWGSIKDYERSGAETTASASESSLMPESPEMGTQLGNFEIVKIKTWPFLSEKTRRIARETEQVFLGFLALVYSGLWNHEVYGGLVPKEVVRNDRIERMISGQSQTYTFSECERAYRKLRAEVEK